MKKMAKREFRLSKFLVVSIALGLLVGKVSFAAPIKFKPIASSSESPGNTGAQPQKNSSREVQVEDKSKKACKLDPDNETLFPLEMFKAITMDSKGISIQVTPDNGIVVSSAGVLNICGEFEPKVTRDDNGNFTVQMINKDEKFAKYSDFRKCFEENAEVKNAIKDGELDPSKIASKNYTSLHEPFTGGPVPDKSKGAAVYYAHSKRTNLDYPASSTISSTFTPGLIGTVKTEDETCYVAQNIKVIQMSREEEIQEIQSRCNNGTLDQLKQLRASLGNYSTITDSLDKIRFALDTNYLNKAMTDEAEGIIGIYKKMDVIGEKLLKEKDTMDESTAEKLVKQYADLAVKLNNDFLDHAIAHLSDLMKIREELSAKDGSEKRIAEIDAEIKNLNLKIKEFSKRKPGHYEALLFLEQKYALTDSARNIESIHQKSDIYSGVYVGAKDSDRGKQLSFTEAGNQHVSAMKKVDKTLEDWTDTYQVGKGSTAPLKKTEKERTMAITRMNKRWQDFQQSENSKYNSTCGIGWTGSQKNPIQCQTFLRGAEKRKNAELKRRDKDLRFVASRNDKLGRMSSNYSEYQRRKVAEDAEGDEDDSYSDYDSRFEDTYPDYYASQGASAYNPYQYSMGMQGMQGMQGQGMQGMYPQMVNPQMPVQQGQFQLNWPTL